MTYPVGMVFGINEMNIWLLRLIGMILGEPIHPCQYVLVINPRITVMSWGIGDTSTVKFQF